MRTCPPQSLVHVVGARVISRDEEGQGVPELTLSTLAMKTPSKIFETEVLLLQYETREKQNWGGCGGWGRSCLWQWQILVTFYCPRQPHLDGTHWETESHRGSQPARVTKLSYPMGISHHWGRGSATPSGCFISCSGNGGR